MMHNRRDRIVPQLQVVAKAIRVVSVLVVLLLLMLSSCTSIQQVVIRGHLLRHELVKAERKPFLQCQLVVEDGSPCLVFEKYESVTYSEIPVYEKVLEFRDPNDSDRHNREYRPVVGEVIRGEQVQREETLSKGPAVDVPVQIDGIAVRTDGNGRYTDSEEIILKYFDDSSLSEINLKVDNTDYGICELRIERDELMHILQIQQDEPNVVADRENLTMRCEVPDALRPGDEFELKLEVTNTGERPSSTISSRLIGRNNWLDGINFYIGSIPPGSTRSFARLIKVPPQQSAGNVFAVIGFCDRRLGAMPEKNLPLIITVE